MSHLFYSPAANLLVESIPKCGLNTVAVSIIYLDGEPFMELEEKHNRPTKKSFDRYVELFYEYKNLPKDISGIDRVAIVRNPFTRALSAFSNKNHRVLKDTEKGDQLPYERFVEFLNKLPRFFDDDHFKPMTWQLTRQSRYNKIFSLENMEEYYGFLSTRVSSDSNKVGIINNIKKTKPRLNTSDSAKRYTGFLNKETAEIIKDMYSDDFKFLKYSVDLKDMKEPRDDS